MLSKYTAEVVEDALRASSPGPVFPPASDREAWGKLAEELGSERVGQITAGAEKVAGEPMPALSASLYQSYFRTGQFEIYQDPCYRRRAMLADLVLAECFAGRGRFIEQILDLAWAICEESSWVTPGGLRPIPPSEEIPTLPDVETPTVTLRSSHTAIDLAELDGLLGAKLHPAFGKRIRYEVKHRIFVPYMKHEHYWWLRNRPGRTTNNWNSICNGSVVCAAVYLESDLQRLSQIIARAAASMDHYLDSFDVDGGCEEGVNYWMHGFARFVMAAQLLEHRTQGRIDLLDDERVSKIARFPLRAMLSPDKYVSFSDCPREPEMSAGMLAYLGERMKEPGLIWLAQREPKEKSGEERQGLAWQLRNLFWRPPAEAVGEFRPARCDWFGGMIWMISRCNPTDPDALVLAVKGGHNNENHNHHDVGSFIVHVKGESVITDVGSGRYTLAYWGDDRYKYFATSSFGHSVPVVNGHLQQNGEEYRAEVLEQLSDNLVDRLVLEIRQAYPAEADLASLRRTAALHRDKAGPWVEMVDDFQFKSGPGKLQSVLVTFGQAKIEDGSAIIQGLKGTLRVKFDPDKVKPRVEEIKDIDLEGGRTDARRVVFTLAEARQEGVISLRIEAV